MARFDKVNVDVEVQEVEYDITAVLVARQGRRESSNSSGAVGMLRAAADAIESAPFEGEIRILDVVVNLYEGEITIYFAKPREEN